MIIRISVKDNDFYSIMNPFVKTMWEYRGAPTKEIDSMTTQEISEEIDKRREHQRIMSLINANNDRKLTNKETIFLTEYIKSQFLTYLAGRNILDTTLVYLLNNFDVTMIDTFVDKWENGEAFYWFQHSNAVINQ